MGRLNREHAMQHVEVTFGEFEVIAGNGQSQAAVMVLPPGESEGGDRNRHKGADQWLYVVAGEGRAIVEDKVYPLAPNTLLLIEHGETHEIHSDGNEPLKTLNFYVPPAYTGGEETLPAGRS
ncbi:MAG TPA: cupin domain-containing protein [Hyphomicrobiales bacterium]|nr:cupin domain-containing protein [Hyphomicrobiales bacterium]